MGYWNTTAEGASLQVEDTGMVWGDAPADEIDTGMEKLIRRLRSELGRMPTVAEVDAVKASAPEMEAAILLAAVVFAEDVGRVPTPEEVIAGLLFAATDIALDSYKERGEG